MSLTSKISRRQLDGLVARCANKGRTLEVGSYGEPSYGRFFPDRVGVDIKPGRGVDIVASVYELPFPDEHFDVVLCMSVLEHLEDPRRGITEMRRVLRPGGRIIVSVPFLFPMHDAPGDFWRFTKYGLRALFSVGWDIKFLTAEGDVQTSLGVILQRVAYQSRFVMDKLVKLGLFIAARVIDRGPLLVRHAYGDIRKSTVEPDAFAHAFFLVAEKQ